MNYDNTDLADYLAGGSFDPEYEYNSKRRELDNKDYRVNKVKTVDVNAEYKEWKEFESSDLNRNVNKAIGLLNDNFDVPLDQVRSTLQSTYGLDGNLTNQVLKTMVNNCKSVEAHQNPYNKKVTLRRR